MQPDQDWRASGSCSYSVHDLKKNHCNQTAGATQIPLVCMDEVARTVAGELLLAKRLRGIFRQSMGCRNRKKIYRGSSDSPSGKDLSGGIQKSLGRVSNGV